MNSNNKKLLRILLMLSGLIVSIWIAWPLFQSGFLEFQGNATVNDAVSWMGVCGVLLFVFLIWLIRTDKKLTTSNASSPDQGLVKISMACALGLLIATSLFNFCVNPWDLYGTTYFISRTNPSRRQKLAYYSQLEETPDLIIIGNSTAFTISPQYIEEKLGYSGFNWAIDGGRPPENRVLLEYMARQYSPDFPVVVLMQIPDKYPLKNSYDMMSIQLLSYLDSREMISEGTTRLSKLISISQWSDSLYVTRYTLSTPTTRWGGWAFNADGFGYKYNNDFSKAFTPEIIGNYQKCAVPNEFHDENIESILALLETHNSSVVFYTSPLLPEFYNTALKDTSDYQKCYQEIVDYFTELSRNHDNVFFKDYLVLENIQGLDAPEGFYDERHLTPQNAERLVDALADTLQQAYTVAEIQRNIQTGGSQ